MFTILPGVGCSASRFEVLHTLAEAFGWDRSMRSGARKPPAPGESEKDAFRMVIDGSLKLEIHGPKVTFDAGLLAYRD